MKIYQSILVFESLYFVEAVRGQKHHISAHTLAFGEPGTLTQCSVHPSAPVLLNNIICYDSQPPYLGF